MLHFFNNSGERTKKINRKIKNKSFLEFFCGFYVPGSVSRFAYLYWIRIRSLRSTGSKTLKTMFVENKHKDESRNNFSLIQWLAVVIVIKYRKCIDVDRPLCCRYFRQFRRRRTSCTKLAPFMSVTGRVCAPLALS